MTLLDQSIDLQMSGILKSYYLLIVGIKTIVEDVLAFH